MTVTADCRCGVHPSWKWEAACEPILSRRYAGSTASDGVTAAARLHFRSAFVHFQPHCSKSLFAPCDRIPPAKEGHEVRAIHFDCFSGISGDMTLAALIDAGADASAIRDGIDSLGLPIKFGHERIRKGGFAATQVHI